MNTVCALLAAYVTTIGLVGSGRIGSTVAQLHTAPPLQ
jgi:phosphoglycerate dehydrogenase-like enzyme